MNDPLFGLEVGLEHALLLAVTAVVSLVLGWLIARARAQRRIAVLETRLEDERAGSLEKRKDMDRAFAALSADALEKNNRLFLQLAQQTLQRFHVHAQGELELRERAVEDLVRPLRETLQRTEQQLVQLERERREAHGALTQHLETLARSHEALQGETRNLVQALRRPEVRGQWGELTLRRLVELAGMAEHCDFVEQVSAGAGETRLRPDMVVYMPGGRQVVVDVKTPLDAYLSAVEASDDEARLNHLHRHALNVRQRVRELASKAYWTQFEQTLDFVVLFIPGDQFLAAALEIDPELLETALARRVILATPTSLVALLRAVAYGWRQESLAANAEQIRATAEEMHDRLATLSEHFVRLGRHIDASVAQFNRLVGSFESKVLPGARKFAGMGITPKKELADTAYVESRPREVSIGDE